LRMTESFLSVLKKKAVHEKKEELVSSLVTRSSHFISSEREKRIGDQMNTIAEKDKRNIGAARRSIFLLNRLNKLYHGLIRRLNDLKKAVATKQSLCQSDFYDIQEYSLETYLDKLIFRCPVGKKELFLPKIIFCGNADLLSDSFSDVSDIFIETAWKVSNFDNDLSTVLESKYSSLDISLFAYHTYMNDLSVDKKEKILEMIEFYQNVLEGRLGKVNTELNDVSAIMISLEAQRELAQHFKESTRVDEAEVIEAVQLCATTDTIIREKH